MYRNWGSDRGSRRAYPSSIVGALFVLVANSYVLGSDPEWEWMNPLPTGNSLGAVRAVGPSDVFAVGDLGTIVHYNGFGWSEMVSGTTQALLDVWGSCPNDVFTVGWAGTILHYDGSTWSSMDSGTTLMLTGVWGSSPNDVFAVGENRSILHYDGRSWSAATALVPDQQLNGIWGSGPNDIFAVGEGLLLHYNGSSWSPMSSGSTSPLCAVSGSGPNNVFAVGGDGLILHYDGLAWSSMTSGYTGTLSDVSSTSPNEAFVVGDDGALHYYNGSSWSPMNSGTTSDLWGVLSRGPRDAFACGVDGTILHYDGNQWSSIRSGEIADLRAAWGSRDDDVFAVGSDGTILHYNGLRWSAMQSGTNQDLLDIWGSGPNDVFAVGLVGTVVHYDGSRWLPMTSGTAEWLFGVWGTGPNNVIAVGWAGTILHFDGTVWSSMTGGSGECLNSLWGSGPNDIFAVGLDRVILHYDGSSWSVMASGTTRKSNAVSGGVSDGSFAPEVLTRVWGTGPNNVFAVEGNAGGGLILHYDGSTWAPMASGTAEWLFGVWGTGPNNVIAVGWAGTILRYDGSTWSSMPKGTYSPLRGVWGTGPNDIFIVGDHGTILHHPRRPPPSQDSTPPNAVTDLRISQATSSSATLTWKAPTDATPVEPPDWHETVPFAASPAGGGIASQYDIRYSTSTIGPDNWAVATQCPDPPAPGTPGTQETLVITGLSPHTHYWFAVKSADAASNWSALSNVADANTLSEEMQNRSPNVPDAPGQFAGDGTTEILEGGTTTGSTVVFKARVSDPDGDQIRLEIELRRTDEQFTGQPTPETIGPDVPSGTQVTITRGSLIEGAYRWQYRAKDSRGGVSQWSQFGTPGNPDFTISPGPNHPPDSPRKVGQFKADGVTAITKGGSTSETTVVFKATLSHPDGDQVKLQVELRRLDEPNFTGEPTLQSDLVPSGSVAMITRGGLIQGSYRWRCRAADASEKFSTWTVLGADDNADFAVSARLPEFYAVLFGVDDTLMLGKNDASAIYEVLLTYPGVKEENLWLRFNPSDANVVHEVVQTAIDRLQPGDHFLFYFSGHGAFQSGPTLVQPYEPMVRLSQTAQRKTGLEWNTGDEILVTPIDIGVTDDMLTRWLSSSPKLVDVRKTVILDTCFSGGFWGKEGNQEDEGDLDKLQNIGLLAACEEGDVALYHPGWVPLIGGRGFFSEALERSLKLDDDGFASADINRDRQVSFEELRSKLEATYTVEQLGNVGFIKASSTPDGDAQVQIDDLHMYARHADHFDPCAPVLILPNLKLTLAVNQDAFGTIRVEPNQTAYLAGTPVTLTAHAAPGYRFVAWTGDVVEPNAADNSLLIVMDRDRTVQATFAPGQPVEPGNDISARSGLPCCGTPGLSLATASFLMCVHSLIRAYRRDLLAGRLR